ncbi:MAG TPA: hypothetical protein PLK79_00150 [Thermoleophilia bacterium]|nr:hypothetical protein [Thermoleophilia bacterium]
MHAPVSDRRWTHLLWVAEGCIAAGAVVTLVRGGLSDEMVATIIYLGLCAVVFLLPGAVLCQAAAVPGLRPERRRLVLQTHLALAAAAVAATLGASRGWEAIIAILATGNALLSLEMEARETSAPDGG